MQEPTLPDGIIFDSKYINSESIEFYRKGKNTIKTLGKGAWTVRELEAIIGHQKWLESSLCEHKNKSAYFAGGSEYDVFCEDCGMELS